MDSKRWQVIRRIYHAALDLNMKDRGAFLKGACDGDESLRQEVESLLARGERAGEFLEVPAAQPTTIVAEDAPTFPPVRVADHAIGGAADVTSPQDGPVLSPDSFAGYQILREIHRGGQGVVYQAVQKTTRRKVAIKVMREGPFAGPADRSRFEREVQVLGQLNHPNIVGVHDSGVAAGHHFFVMDYVSGQPLDAFMAGGERSINETLKLFGKICEAVNAAHLRGVIHRDLKPGNIRIDDNGDPHVLDFGLAKVACGAGSPIDESGPHIMTMTGQFIGSLPWASPEQAEGSPGKIDVRTDVYSLGVILYQMLTSRFPYDVIGNIRDVLDRIIKAEPVRPRVASASGGWHGRLAREINDEVETIVLKCLSKERERRYQSAGELGRDINRYLAGDPIEAKRESMGYVLRKQLRRYRFPVAVAAGFVILVTAGFITSLTFWRKAVEQRDRAVQAEQDQSRAREEAVHDRLRAEKALAGEADQRALADKRRDEAEVEAYVANLAAAHAAIDANEMSSARLRLDACPERLRGWEWRWLNAASDRSLVDLRGHEARVNTASFSPDGTRIVTASDDKTARVWDAATGKELMVLSGHERSVYSAIFSPDSTRVLTKSDDNTLRIWDSSSGEELAILRHSGRFDVDASFNSDGSLIVTTANDQPVQIWEAKSGRELSVLPYTSDRGPSFSGASFSADGKRILISGGNAEIWDVSLKKQLMVPRGHKKYTFHARFSPDDTRIVTASADKTARVWDAASGNELLVLRGHEDTVMYACFNPDGTRIVTCSSDRTARLWDALTGREMAVLRGHVAPVSIASFNPDGSRCITASWDGTLHLWDTTLGKQLMVFQHNGRADVGKFSPDGTRIVTVSTDNTARVWDIAMTKELAVHEHRDCFTDAAFTPDGIGVLTTSLFGPATLWDASLGRVVAIFGDGKSAVFRARLSPDGGRVVTTFMGMASPRVWDTATSNKLAELRGHEGKIWTASFSPDGAQIVTGSEDKTARIWTAATGQEIAILRGHKSEVHSASFSPDGNRILTTSDDGTARLWDAKSQQELAVLHTSANDYKTGGAARFSPDGELILTAGIDSAALWDGESGRRMAEIEGKRPARFSVDGSRIVAASRNNIARIWDSKSGKSLATLRGHDDAIEDALFSPDGTRVVTASRDQTARIWDAVSGKELVVLRGHAIRIRYAVFSPDGTRILTASEDGTSPIWDTVPYRERFPAIEASRRAIAQLRPKIEELIARGVTIDSVADELIGNQDNDPTTRTAARIILAELRQKEYDKAAARIEEARRVYNAAWSLVRFEPVDQRAANSILSDVRSAMELEPENVLIHTLLGVALYRTGHFDKALKELNITSKKQGYGHPADLAFIAMAYARLGHREQAISALEKLRGLMKLDLWSKHPEAQRFLEEAEQVVAMGREIPTSQPVADQPATTGPAP